MENVQKAALLEVFFNSFVPINLHLYHYAGNNPVRYVDPDGRASVTNESGETILIKPENSDNPYFLLRDKETYYGEIDGVIFANGTVIKTYGKSDYTAKRGKNDTYSLSGGKLFDFIGNIVKCIKNMNKMDLESKGVDTDNVGMRWEDPYMSYQYGNTNDTFLDKWLGNSKNVDYTNSKKADSEFIPIKKHADGTIPLKQETLNYWNGKIKNEK